MLSQHSACHCHRLPLHLYDASTLGFDPDYTIPSAIVTGWQAIMKAIFPSAIDGDLLKLVHLSNGFKTIPGSGPLKAGDVCRAEARVVGVVNGDPGKTVRQSGSLGMSCVRAIRSSKFSRRSSSVVTSRTTRIPSRRLVSLITLLRLPLMLMLAFCCWRIGLSGLTRVNRLLLARVLSSVFVLTR
jgi:hypothetical protein